MYGEMSALWLEQSGEKCSRFSHLSIGTFSKAALCLLGHIHLQLGLPITPTLHVNGEISLEMKKWSQAPSATSHSMHRLEAPALFMVLQKTDRVGRHDVWECWWLTMTQGGTREQQYLSIMFLLGCEAVRSAAEGPFLLL